MEAVARDEALHRRPHWLGGGLCSQVLPWITNERCREIPLTIRLPREAEIREMRLNAL